MNYAILIGRLTRDPEIRYNNDKTIAKYTIAVDRSSKKDGDQNADFISCVAFDRAAEFAEKYLHKGTKIAIEGRIQTGKYTNKDGNTVYTTDVVVNRHEFVEPRGEARPETKAETKTETKDTGFVDIPDNIDEELPFA